MSTPSIQNYTKPKENRHIVFIKVHKAASTTVMNVFLRFAIGRNLTIMLPRTANVISEEFSVRLDDILPSFTDKFDILCNHVIYNRSVISRYFPQDTKYVTILREPFDQFVSAFMYYRDVYPHKYLTEIDGDRPISKYLEKPQKYEPKKMTDSFTHNRMSIDLGFSGSRFTDETLINQFVQKISQEFDLVMISEYFDESMVLLKRTLNWKLEDVLYITSNTFSKYKNNLNLTTEDRENHRGWAKVDYALYQYFYDLFWLKIHAEPADFVQEVRTLRSLRKAVSDFCFQKNHKQPKTILKRTKWSDDIVITRTICKSLTTSEIELMEVIKGDYMLKYAKFFAKPNPASPTGSPKLKHKIQKSG